VAAIATLAVVAVPFLAWSPRAFVDDVILFPLGWGQPRPNHPSPTPGALLARAFPSWRTALAIVAAATAIGLAAWLVARAPHPTASGVAAGAGAVLLAGMLLAPGARVGDLVFPIDLLVWSRLLRAPAVRLEGTAPHRHRESESRLQT
jgi:hypothetical protein